ncbi:MAG: S8 family serine peptidase [Calditrichaeota bacterium]|nr:S8 family serine peptidase [Calditrichota bacterium]
MRKLLSALAFIVCLIIITVDGSAKGRWITPKPDLIPSYNKESFFLDRITIKFIEGSGVFLTQNKFESRSGLDMSSINELVGRFNMHSGRKLFSQRRNYIDELRRNGMSKTGKELADLNLYFIVTIDSTKLCSDIIKALINCPVVETAYPKSKICLPFDIEPETALFSGDQGYLYDAPEGIDAPAVWEIAGGLGEGVKIIDIEYCWTFEHEDLKEPFHVSEIQNQQFINHGDAVIGIMIGQHNDYGIDGICPEAQIGGISVSSIENVADIADLIINASEQLDEGDIVVLEIQTQSLWPIESVQDVFDAIEIITSNGIIVVEAGANGNHNLDIDERFDPENRHSGSILVGAGNPPIGEWGQDRSRCSFSNYGTRFDLQGWGWGIVTTGYGDLFYPNSDERQWYTAEFSGTSGATPIVTGAVACVQGIYKDRFENEFVLSGNEIRDILRNSGSPQQNGPHGNGNIGPRPNLRAALELIPQIPGTLNGVVFDAATNEGIDSALIYTDYGVEVFTDENGEWEIENAMSGNEFSITASKAGYNDSTVTNLILEIEGSLDINFGLLHPTFALSDSTFNFILDQDLINQDDLTIQNNGNGVLEWYAEKHLTNVEEIDPWTVRNTFNIGSLVDDNRIEGVVFQNEHFYISGANNQNPLIYVMNLDGEVTNSFPQTGQNPRGFRDLASDGEVIWGVETNMIYGFTPEGEEIISIQAPFGPLTGITWDFQNEVFWVTGLGYDIAAIDIEGNVHVELDNPNLLIYGLAYLYGDMDGYPIYIFSRVQDNTDQVIWKMNPDNGDTLFVAHLDPEIAGSPGGAFISSDFDNFSNVFINVTNTSPNDGGDRIYLRQINSKTSWLNLSSNEGSVNPGSSEQLDLIINSNFLLPLLYTGEFIFSHNADSGLALLPVTLEVLEPMPPSEFSLLTPEDGEIIQTSEIEFSWENSVDPNIGDVVEYQLWLEFADDSISFIIPEPQVTILLDSLEFDIEWENDFCWWVISSSHSDSVVSRERFSFSYFYNTISGDQVDVPVKFGIQSVHPNPFNSQINLHYGLPEKSHVRISIVDISGRVVEIIENGHQPAGNHRLQWQAEGLSTGMYFLSVNVQEGSYRGIQKVIMLK